MTPISIHPIAGLPEITPGAPLAELILAGIRRLRLLLEANDVVVVTQKIVSKSEGRILQINDVTAGAEAKAVAAETGLDPRHVEVILRESVRIVRQAPRVLITETRHGFICANAGVDRSNAGGPDRMLLLPVDPDASATRLRADLGRLSGVTPGVIVSDSFGRAWREGQVNVAVGADGVTCLKDYRGETDPDGYNLHGTVLAVGDELAAAAELVMRKLDRIPAALIRGATVAGTDNARVLLREPSIDLFR